MPERCNYCGSWSTSAMQYYSWRKSMMLTRCPDCDRRIFDLQMTIVIVGLVLVAALVCAFVGVWPRVGGRP